MKTVTQYTGDSAAGGEWLSGTGPEAEIVISSRVRLARNLAGHRFLSRVDAAGRADIEREIRAALAQVRFPGEMVYLDLETSSRLDADLLVERHLISRELARGQGPRGVCYSANEAVSIMVCEEDHLRMQVLRSGLQLDAAWDLANEIDDTIGERLEYAFSSRYGYLTCCPTNVGTGIRASVMLHLPALVYTKHIEKVFSAGSKMDLAVRGLYGEGTQATGDFYQISNQKALGSSEAELLETLNRLVPQFVEYERQVRGALLAGDRAALEDKVWRGLAILRAARTVTSGEALELLSAVRLGRNLGLLPPTLTTELLNELFMTAQPAHLQRFATGPQEPKERDIARASLMREKLGELS